MIIQVSATQSRATTASPTVIHDTVSVVDTVVVKDTVAIQDISGPKSTDWLGFYVTVILAGVAAGGLIIDLVRGWRKRRRRREEVEVVMGFKALSLSTTVQRWMMKLEGINPSVEHYSGPDDIRAWIEETKAQMDAATPDFEQLDTLSPDASSGVGDQVVKSLVKFYVLRHSMNDMTAYADPKSYDVTEINKSKRIMLSDWREITMPLTEVAKAFSKRVARAQQADTTPDTPKSND